MKKNITATKYIILLMILAKKKRPVKLVISPPNKHSCISFRLQELPSQLLYIGTGFPPLSSDLINLCSKIMMNSYAGYSLNIWNEKNVISY